MVSAGRVRSQTDNRLWVSPGRTDNRICFSPGWTDNSTYLEIRVRFRDRVSPRVRVRVRMWIVWYVDE